mmetsp:Transcript_19514/g.43478  ORF Transcript_19514/g.43478 Transcript_19514/m.43478 type:complete len:206 (+) Transcript_19514:424-1041(+)
MAGTCTALRTPTTLLTTIPRVLMLPTGELVPMGMGTAGTAGTAGLFPCPSCASRNPPPTCCCGAGWGLLGLGLGLGLGQGQRPRFSVSPTSVRSARPSARPSLWSRCTADTSPAWAAGLSTPRRRWQGAYPACPACAQSPPPPPVLALAQPLPLPPVAAPTAGAATWCCWLGVAPCCCATWPCASACCWHRTRTGGGAVPRMQLC